MKLMAKVMSVGAPEDSMFVGEQRGEGCALALRFWLNKSVDKL